jgi:hypothetical protein
MRRALPPFIHGVVVVKQREVYSTLYFAAHAPVENQEGKR